jgi:hypothetical protein
VLSGFSSGTIGKTPPKKGAKTKTVKSSPVLVSVAGSTTYTETQAVNSATLAVGDCVTAAGSTDTTGTVTAAVIQITSTGGASCTASGFPGGVTGG